jgi:hypothetical protein
MSDLQGQVGELRFTVKVTRKETGKVEEVKLVGYFDEEKLKELQNGSDSLNSSPQRCD